MSPPGVAENTGCMNFLPIFFRVRGSAGIVSSAAASAVVSTSPAASVTWAAAAVSSGSACTSASLEPSYVLRSLGVGDDLAHSSIRFGFGRFTTVEEIDYTAEKVSGAVKRLREMSPLYEMVQEGIDLSTVQWTSH